MIASRSIRALLLWVPVGAIPLLDGAIRLVSYGPRLGEPASSLISTACDIALIAAYALWAQRRWPATSRRRALGRGALWLALSTANHFALGLWAFGMSAASLVAKYDFLNFETWGLISLVIFAAPWFAAARRGTGRPSSMAPQPSPPGQPRPTPPG